MKKFYSLYLVCLLFANANLFAVPATPYPIEVTQPDGTTLTIRLHGDEHFHYTSTLDGFLIVKNQQNAFVYATVSQTGKLLPTKRIARNKNARTASDITFLQNLDTNNDISRLYTSVNSQQRQKTAMQADEQTPLRYANGSQKALVILVNFQDKSFSNYTPQTAQIAFDNLCNQQNYSVNGATGSVKDWYKASSYGQFIPDFDVFGPYTLPNDMVYYGENYPNPNSNDRRPAQMIVDACNLANPYVDFTNYSSDGVYIDNVFVVYAGHNEAEGGGANTVWPHRWAVQPGYNVPTGTNVTFDGRKLWDYACTSELRGSSGTTIAGIGTFVHEFAHVIGMPDYYHTTQSSTKNALEYWSVMDRGSYCNNSRTPPLFSAYDRFYLGWLTPEQYTSGQRTLYPLSQSGTTAQAGQAYLLSATNHNLIGDNPSPKEFFVIEYREKTGWDAYIGNNSTANNTTASSGMLIWHIDYNLSAWNNNTVNNYTGSSQTQASHMRVYLQPTNGQSTTTPGGAFTSGSFTPKLWNGSTTGLPVITNIVKNSTTMTFGENTADVPKAPTAFTVTPNAGGALSAVLQWTNPAQTVAGLPVTLTRVEIHRNGALIHTISSPVAGAIVSWTDNPPTSGTHTYTVYAYNTGGASAPATQTVFVGPDPCVISTFPWTETFENASTTDCWDVVRVSGSADWFLGTNISYVPAHTTYAYFYKESYTNDTTKLTSPVLQLNSSNIYKLSFDMVNRAWGSDINHLKIYYRTSATSAWTLIPNQIYTTANENWTTKTNIELPNPSATYQIAFEGINKYGRPLAIDNVKFEEIISIFVPPTVTTLPANPVGTTYATLNKNITAGTETITVQGFKYKKTSESTWQTSANGSLTNLIPNTEYQFFAYATTATFPMTTGDTLSFTTQCQTYNHSENINICNGASHTFPDGTNMNNITAPLAHANNLTSVYGCDSVVVTNISIKPTYNDSENVSVCSGASHTFPDGTTINNITAPFAHTNNLTSVYDCDSIVVTNISIKPIYNHSENVSVCSGANYTFPDNTTTNNITVPFAHTNNLTSVLGCDSVVVTNVSVKPLSYGTFEATFCEGNGGAYQYLCPDCHDFSNLAATTYIFFPTLPATNGCDSIVTLTLYVLPTFHTIKYDTIFENEPYNEQTYPVGNYQFDTIYTAENSCDSIVTIYLHVKQTSGINEAEFGNIKIYPNPVKEELRIKSEELRIKSVEITDLAGKKILTTHSSLLTTHYLILNTNSLPQGIYFIKIQSENSKIVFEKFIKE